MLGTEFTSWWLLFSWLKNRYWIMRRNRKLNHLVRFFLCWNRSTYLVGFGLRQHSSMLHIGSFQAIRVATKTLPRSMYCFAARAAVVAIRMTLPPSSACLDLHFCNVGEIGSRVLLACVCASMILGFALNHLDSIAFLGHYTINHLSCWAGSCLDYWMFISYFTSMAL